MRHKLRRWFRRRQLPTIEALDNKVPAGLQSAMLIECGRLIERVAVWILRAAEGLRRRPACWR